MRLQFFLSELATYINTAIAQIKARKSCLFLNGLLQGRINKDEIESFTNSRITIEMFYHVRITNVLFFNSSPKFVAR